MKTWLEQYDEKCAEVEMLREALEFANGALESIHDGNAYLLPEHVVSYLVTESIKIDTTLSASSGEWLERHDDMKRKPWAEKLLALGKQVERLREALEKCPDKVLDAKRATRDERTFHFDEANLPSVARACYAEAHLRVQQHAQAALADSSGEWLERQIAEASQRHIEELEARLCPEDVGIDELVRSLSKQLAALREERDGLAAAVLALAEKNDRWIRTFEDLDEDNFAPADHAALYAVYNTDDASKAQDDAAAILAQRDADKIAEGWKAGLARGREIVIDKLNNVMLGPVELGPQVHTLIAEILRGIDKEPHL